MRKTENGKRKTEEGTSHEEVSLEEVSWLGLLAVLLAAWVTALNGWGQEAPRHRADVAGIEGQWVAVSAVAEAGSWLDHGGSGWNGTCTGNATVTADGAVLDGTGDEVTCGNVSAFDSATTITMMFWGYRSATNNVLAVAKGNDPLSISYRFALQVWNDGKVYVPIYKGESAYAYCAFTGTGWHHFAVVYNGGGATNADRAVLYVDGVQQSLSFNLNIPTSTPNFTGQLRIGNTGYPGVTLSTGTLNDIRVYSRVLTAGEIYQVYMKGRP